jgi:Flp pilus assembly pilin Flp
MTTRLRQERRQEGLATPGRRSGWRLGDRRGQAVSEYITLSGVIAVIVIASMTMFTRPVAFAFARLFRRLVLYMTGAS